MVPVHLMLFNNMTLIEIKEGSRLVQLGKQIHVMNLELFIIRQTLIHVAFSRRGYQCGTKTSTSPSTGREHFQEGAARSVRRPAPGRDRRDIINIAIGRCAGAAVAKITHLVLILVFVAGGVLEVGERERKIRKGGRPGSL